MRKFLIRLLRLISRTFGEQHFVTSIVEFFVREIFVLRKVEGLDRKAIGFYIQKLKKDLRISERLIENPWVLSEIGPVENIVVLDVGCRKGTPPTDFIIDRNCQLFGVDPDIDSEIIISEKTKIIKGDIRNTHFPNAFFDLVLIVSTLEHIGVPGRFHLLEDDKDGDIKAMQEIHRILKPGGKVIATIPYGCGESLPLNRLYGSQRVNELFSEFQIDKSEYFKYYNEYHLWLKVSEKVAYNNNWDTDIWYSLACFSLIKPELTL